jgi:hypothetical protein
MLTKIIRQGFQISGNILVLMYTLRVLAMFVYNENYVLPGQGFVNQCDVD